MTPSKTILTILSAVLLHSVALSQDYNINIDWKNNTIQSSGKDASKESVSDITFEGAFYDEETSSLPIFSTFYPLKLSTVEVKINLINTIYSDPKPGYEINQKDYNLLSSNINITHYNTIARKKNMLALSMTPMKLGDDGEVKILISATVQIKEISNNNQMRSGGFTFSDNSVLANGDWYRISTTKDGIYKMDYAFLSSVGIDLNAITPDQINIYGSGGEMLPMKNFVDRYDDLQQNSILIVGDDDGSFDSGDYILFYAKGPDSWKYDPISNNYTHEKHRYSNKAFYYIGINTDPAKRIEPTDVITEPITYEVNSFDAISFHEVDIVNLNQSGRELFGENFDLQTEYTFSGSEFSFPNIDESSPVKVKTRIISLTQNSSYGEWEVECNGNIATANVPAVGSGSYHARGKSKVISIPSFNPTSDNLNVKISFQKEQATEEGWLDYIEIQARRHLIMNGSQLSFRDSYSLGTNNISKFTLSSAASVSRIWDVTDPVNVRYFEGLSDGDNKEIIAESDTLKEYIAFRNSGYLTPEFVESVTNQNLHGLEAQDMIIVAPPIFTSQANELADLHRSEGLLVTVATPQEIYNEFSSGNPDITAIKSLCKMFYDRAGDDESMMLDYLLLMGDATYLNNNINPQTSGYILSYQSRESLKPLSSYVTDDYYGFLDDNESYTLGNSVDLGIGRFPASSVEDMSGIVKKIKIYSSTNTNTTSSDCFSDQSSVFGDWRNRTLFVGDDGDGKDHIEDANLIAQIVEEDHKEYNVNKIFMDAYPQLTTAGGERYPGVEKDLRENIERGALIVTYFGHGGEVGLAHERIIDLPTIKNFTNLHRLPVFLTATCEFSRFDDHERVSAGEQLLINPNGGGIALLSTSRPVYASKNFVLGKAFYNLVFENNTNEISYGSSITHEINHGLRLGDITRITKNGIPASENKRNFTLLGDPAMAISYPKYSIVQDQILDVNSSPIDTIKALQRITIKGHIEDNSGNLMTNFNGYINPTVFDKEKTIQTLMNDPESDLYEFKLQTNVLYQGNATVENGYFEYTFIVPKDISYQEGTGRISYYAIGDGYDAIGYNYNESSDQAFYISGQNSDAEEDNVGPEIELFINDESFVDGGVTNQDPIFIAKISDMHGINTSNSGIGHDITLTIDDNAQNIILLNNLYKSDLDTYKSGSIRYPMKDISNGSHTLKLKAWDIYNNSSERTISFEVASSSELVLENVINYPNPFTTYTEFMFQHNQQCSNLDVEIQIFTVSGKLVKTIHNTLIAHERGSDTNISWNGRDDYGEKLARGVYVYKLKVRTPSGVKEEVFEKLVILN